LTGKKREQWDCHAERVMTISPNNKTHATHECITPVMELGGREGGRGGGREGGMEGGETY